MQMNRHVCLNIPPPPPNITINQVKINQVRKATVLGVEIDGRLSWDSHVDKVAKKGIYYRNMSYQKNS